MDYDVKKLTNEQKYKVELIESYQERIRNYTKQIAELKKKTKNVYEELRGSFDLDTFLKGRIKPGHCYKDPLIGYFRVYAINGFFIEPYDGRLSDWFTVSIYGDIVTGNLFYRKKESPIEIHITDKLEEMSEEEFEDILNEAKPTPSPVEKFPGSYDVFIEPGTVVVN